jgi:hypothetical protein
MKSRTEMDEPSRVMPNKDKLDPNLIKLRIETVDPRFKKSSTDKDAPIAAMP